MAIYIFLNIYIKIYLMNKNEGIKKYLEEMIPNKYYISLILDDLIRYFNFIIIEDTLFNDLRTINLTNNNGCSITITSKIISYINEKFTQYNKITYRTSNDYIDWEYFGIQFKKNK